MYYCEKCNIDWEDNEELIPNRDGDAYDPKTNWWWLCPRCLTVIKEGEE